MKTRMVTSTATNTASKTADAPPPVLDGRVATVDALGKIIRNVRKQQGLTQADISGLAATGNRFVVDLEKGKPTIQLQKTLDVLALLGLELVVRKKGGS